MNKKIQIGTSDRKVVSVRIFDLSNNLILEDNRSGQVTEYSYGLDNNVIFKRITNTNPKTKIVTSIFSSTYDMHGKIISQNNVKVYSHGGTAQSETKFTYDEEGRLSRKTKTEPGKDDRVEIFDYYPGTNLKRSSIVLRKDKGITEENYASKFMIINQYDDDGRIIRKINKKYNEVIAEYEYHPIFKDLRTAFRFYEFDPNSSSKDPVISGFIKSYSIDGSLISETIIDRGERTTINYKSEEVI